MNLKFRDAEIDDLQIIVDIYNSTIPSRMVTADTEPVSVESRKKWFAEHTHSKRPIWVIEYENNIIGWVSFQSFYGRPAYDSTAEISIYLDAGQRGKGYGKMALQYAIEQSPSLGINTLLGFIFAHNKPSIELFKRFDFENWGCLPDVAVLDGIQRSVIIMGRKIYP